MDKILVALFVAVLSVMGLNINHQITVYAQTVHYLKEDLEIATHDAALEIDQTELSNGRIVFVPDRAESTFRNSFEKNSRLSSSDYEIVDIQFFDESTVSNFPQSFNSSHANFSTQILGPTVLAFVKVKRDAYFSNNSSETYIQVASYTYKQNTRSTPAMPGEIIGSPNEQGFVWPVPFTTEVTSPFGDRYHPISGEYSFHAGTDIAAPGAENTPVVAAKPGTVTFVGEMGSYGNLVTIDHGNGVETRYAHLNSFQTSVGSTVSAGQVVGLLGNTGGSTGPHLHFEIRYDGVPYNPMGFY